jgi:hypothetical protein
VASVGQDQGEGGGEEGAGDHAGILTVRRAARQGYGADAKARERREVTFARLCCRWRDGDKPPRYRFIRA